MTWGNPNRVITVPWFSCPCRGKMLPQTHPSRKTDSVRSVLLIADIQSFLLNSYSLCASSPWFVTTRGTLEKFTPLSRSALCPQPKIKHSPIFSVTSIFSPITHSHFAIRDVHGGCSKRYYVTEIDLEIKFSRAYVQLSKNTIPWHTFKYHMEEIIGKRFYMYSNWSDCRVFIRSRVPGTGTRLLWTEYPATYSAKLKKKNSNKKIINLN